jgi:YidC/Oxa1 family membrane protein insertase
MLPVTIRAVQNGARMAVMKPHMQKLQEEFQNSNTDDPESQKKLQKEMGEMFQKYKVNPLKAMLVPLFQIPVFLGFFFALQDIHKFYPDMHTGGAYWFPDLAVADSTYILPAMNMLSILIMIEIGADGAQTAQTKLVKNIMRGVGIIVFPMTYHFPASLFLYWNTNNVFSLGQTKV